MCPSHRHRLRRRAPAALSAAVLAAVAVSACGSSGSSATHPASAHTVTRTVTRPAATRTASTTSSSRTSTTTTTGGPTSNTQAGLRQCVAADLKLSFLGGQGATGHGLLAFALRNTSQTTCRTGGYPGVLFLDGAGRGLPTTPQHTTDDFFGHTTLRELTVAPGATVSFRLGVSHVGSGGSDRGCVTAHGLQVIPPNDTHTLRLTGIELAECGGTVSVSPLLAGRSALS